MKQLKARAMRTEVEEGLFGEPNHVLQRRKILDDKWFNTNNSNEGVQINTTISKNIFECKENKVEKNVHLTVSKEAKIFCPETEEKVRIISQDLLRSLKVPNESIKPKSLLLTSNEYINLRTKANVLTEEQKEELKELEKQDKEKQMNDSRERRTFMQTMDLRRRRNEKLSDLEEEAYRKSQYLLEKAMQQREEQEAEIKLMNNMAKNTQIQAIRDAQCLEKKQIAKELHEEELRLDRMMETERQNQILIQEAIDKKRSDEEKLGAYEVLKQIENNEEEKLLELEMKGLENKEYQKKFVDMMEGELQRRIHEETKKHKMRQELDVANSQLIAKRHYEKELDIALTQRVLEIQKEKAAHEEAYENEQKRIKKEKELDIARLRALQEKFQDEKAERDGLKARRAMEDAEREWRRKEEEEISKKISTESILKLARAEQMRDKARQAGLQAAKDHEDFDRMLKTQKDAIEKEIIERDKKFGKIAQYKDDITKQIRDKERQLIIERHEFFQEGVEIEEQARLRKVRMDAAKARKFNELRKSGLSEYYLTQLEGKLQRLKGDKMFE